VPNVVKSSVHHYNMTTYPYDRYTSAPATRLWYDQSHGIVTRIDWGCWT
jgi:hypothetical protein